MAVQGSNGNRLANFEAGISWRFIPRLGLKLEFRNHAPVGNDSANIATFRIPPAFH